MHMNQLMPAALYKAELPIPTRFFVVDMGSGRVRFNRSGRLYYGHLVGWEAVSADTQITVRELLELLSARLHWIPAAILMHSFPPGKHTEVDLSIDVASMRELASFMAKSGEPQAATTIMDFARECARVHQVEDRFAALRRYREELDDSFAADA